MKKKTEWVYFKEIEKEVGIKDVLDRYGLLKRLKKEKDNLVGFCPIHNGNHPTRRSFCANTSKNTWHCFSCGESGNVLDFVCAMEDVDVKLAASLIKKWFGIVCDEDREMFKEIKLKSLSGR